MKLGLKLKDEQGVEENVHTWEEEVMGDWKSYVMWVFIIRAPFQFLEWSNKMEETGRACTEKRITLRRQI